MGFQQGLSGLSAASRSLDVIGHNIANANTTGFKSSRAEFADMYATALNGAGTNNVGIGTTLQAVAQQFTQGGFDNTGIATNVAIQGSGFFVVGAGNNQSYTRAGNFHLSSEGKVVTTENGRRMAKGKCPVCGTNLNRILAKA